MKRKLTSELHNKFQIIFTTVVAVAVSGCVSKQPAGAAKPQAAAFPMATSFPRLPCHFP